MTVLAATFSDFRPVKSRGVVQLVFEMPQERAKQALDLLGFPNPAAEVWVGIAKLTGRPEADMETGAGGAEGRASVKAAALRCQEEPFQRWMLRSSYIEGSANENAAETAEQLRQALRIGSRSEIGTDPRALRAWRALMADYQKYQRSEGQ